MSRKGEPLGVNNTLALDVEADQLATPTSVEELVEWLQTLADQPLYVLGQGSNVVLGARLEGLTLIPSMNAMILLGRNDHSVDVRAEAGVVWDDLVAWTVKQGWHGLENLSLIPGSVGAAPVQNIGAYGVELADVLSRVQVFDRLQQDVYWLAAAECDFGYRHSRFKCADYGRFIILAVDLCLPVSEPCRIDYGPLKAAFEHVPAEGVTAQAVRDAVIRIRQSKLPDPAVLPNAGSFFKNPVVSRNHAEQLRKQHPELVSYRQDDSEKLAAGWLIERAGWKGRRLGPVGMHQAQALVMVNYGGATREHIQQLAEAVKTDVMSQFGVMLEQEPINMPA